MIYVVLGTKAQLVKMAPLMHELAAAKLPYRFIFTGQHQETMDALRENFAIKSPDVVLHNGSDITSIPQMLIWIIKILWQTFWYRHKIFPERDKKGVVLVHGDTFSTLLGALMGKVAKLKVAHVESGLRSFNIFHPFPEELTRIATFLLSDIYYCPGDWAIENLKRFRGTKIDTRYNTLLDSLRHALTAEERQVVECPSQPYCVVTTHRFENIFRKEVFARNIELIEMAAEKFKTVFILHPVTERKLEQFGLMERIRQNPNFDLRPRYDYFNFIRLVSKAEFLISDGGSNQEECYYMGKPCLLLRRTSERQEGLGRNVIISNYDPHVVKRFISHYSQHVLPQLPEQVSPSRIIVDNLRHLSALPNFG